MAAVVQTHQRECAVCTNDFTTPKILPCGHLLCRECVISWLDLKSGAGCPLCKCPIVEHQGNLSRGLADVADALPTDYVMEAIVESACVLGKDNMCTLCDDVTAEYICIQCMEKMCQSCMMRHKKMVATRSHDVESLSTVTPERLAASRPTLCADHGDKQAEFFCFRHNLVICTSCSSNIHSACLNVSTLDDGMRSVEKELGSLTIDLVKAEDDLKQAIGNLTVRVETAYVTEQENMALVDKTCDRLHKMVEEYRKQLKKLISDSISKFKNSLCDVKSELETRLGKVTSHKHLVTRATTVRPRPALIHAAQTLTDRVYSLDLSAKLETEAWVNPSPEITKYCDDVVKVMNAELQRLELQQFEVKKPVLVFHENCGTNIRLTKYNTTAERVQPDSNGNVVVMSRDAMAVNVLYEVKIDKINTQAGGSMFLGVTRTPPAQLTLPTSSYYLKESVILWDTGVRNEDKLLSSNVGNALKFIKVRSRVGLLVDSSHNLHFYADGQDQGVAAEDVAQPCFTVFDFRYNVIQVTALPTSRRT